MREIKFPKTLILAFAFPTQKYCQNVGYILFVPFSFSGANRNFQIDSVGQLLVLLALNHGKNLSRLVLLSTLLKSCTIISRGVLECWDDLGQSKAGGCCWSAQLDRKWKNSA